jgi:hypothetical protein
MGAAQRVDVFVIAVPDSAALSRNRLTSTSQRRTGGRQFL